MSPPNDPRFQCSSFVLCGAPVPRRTSCALWDSQGQWARRELWGPNQHLVSVHTQDASEVPCSLFSGTWLQAVRGTGSAGSRKVASASRLHGGFLCSFVFFAPTVVFCVLIFSTGMDFELSVFSASPEMMVWFRLLVRQRECCTDQQETSLRPPGLVPPVMVHFLLYVCILPHF